MTPERFAYLRLCPTQIEAELLEEIYALQAALKQERGDILNSNTYAELLVKHAEVMRNNAAQRSRIESLEAQVREEQRAFVEMSEKANILAGGIERLRMGVS